MTAESGAHLAFPFRIAANGRTEQVGTVEKHVQGEIIQLVLTNPAERPFVTEFGSGIRSLLFENVDDSTAAVTNARVTDMLNRWLGHRAELQDLQIAADNETLEVTIQYRVAGTPDTRILKFQRGPSTE